MTTRLYYTDTYLRTFNATIVERADDGRRLYLDRSAFYPTSGGQPHDLGTLGGVDVIDVVDEEERVAHVLAAPYTGPDAVHGAIDWPRRWDFVQQHTGQHLLSGIFEELFDWPTVSVHFGDVLSTLEIRTPGVSPAQLRRVEEHANALVAENRPVTVTFEDAAAVAARLRRPSMRTGTLRIVTIEGHDTSACGGTHVRATGEIGAILLRRVRRRLTRTRRWRRRAASSPTRWPDIAPARSGRPRRPAVTACVGCAVRMTCRPTNCALGRRRVPR